MRVHIRLLALPLSSDPTFPVPHPTISCSSVQETASADPRSNVSMPFSPQHRVSPATRSPLLCHATPPADASLPRLERCRMSLTPRRQRRRQKQQKSREHPNTKPRSLTPRPACPCPRIRPPLIRASQGRLRRCLTIRSSTRALAVVVPRCRALLSRRVRI